MEAPETSTQVIVGVEIQAPPEQVTLPVPDATCPYAIFKQPDVVIYTKILGVEDPVQLLAVQVTLSCGIATLAPVPELCWQLDNPSQERQPIKMS